MKTKVSSLVWVFELFENNQPSKGKRISPGTPAEDLVSLVLNTPPRTAVLPLLTNISVFASRMVVIGLPPTDWF
jgi:hypothetical protein